jgi:hypothetical protein
MSQTDSDRVVPLAGDLFDRHVVPLASDRAAAGGQAYFPLARDPDAATYFVPADLAVMQPSDFEFPGGGSADGLIDALVARWREQGETALAAMGPLLHDLADAARAEAEEGDGSVDILCYTMF